jgi:hypothetical protein
MDALSRRARRLRRRGVLGWFWRWWYNVGAGDEAWYHGDLNAGQEVEEAVAPEGAAQKEAAAQMKRRAYLVPITGYVYAWCPHRERALILTVDGSHVVPLFRSELALMDCMESFGVHHYSVRTVRDAEVFLSELEERDPPVLACIKLRRLPNGGAEFVYVHRMH